MIPIDIGLSDYFFNLLLWQLLPYAIKHGFELLSRDVAAVVLVEEPEGLDHLALVVRVPESLRHHDHELVEGDHAVSIVVDHVEELLRLLLGRWVAQLPQKRLQLVRLYHAIAVLVKSLEGLV